MTFRNFDPIRSFNRTSSVEYADTARIDEFLFTTTDQIKYTKIIKVREDIDKDNLKYDTVKLNIYTAAGMYKSVKINTIIQLQVYLQQ